MDEVGTVLLFSYGTLQDEAVQRACFGRRLDGASDRLDGYTRSWIEIPDPSAVDDQGTTYPILDPTGDMTSEVTGQVFELTDAELASADAYEGTDYSRVRVQLRSGKDAWVYVRPGQGQGER